MKLQVIFKIEQIVSDLKTSANVYAGEKINLIPISVL